MTAAATATVELIPLGAISLPKDDLRKKVDPASIAELAAEIKAQGLIHPLTLRPDGPGRFVVVAGGRRYRALKLNGATHAPALIRELDDAAAAEIRLVENLGREDLTVLELAAGYKAWLEQTGGTQETLAARIGRTSGHVSQVLAVLKLPKAGQKLLLEGQIGLAHARELQRLAAYPEVLAGRLAAIEEDYPFDGIPELTRLKRDVSVDLEEAEAEVKAKAKAVQEEERRKQLGKELAAAKKAKDQKAIDKLEKALAPPAPDQPAPRVLTATEKAERKKMSNKARITRQEKIVALELAPGFAKAVQKLAGTIKVPDQVAVELVDQIPLGTFWQSDLNPDVLAILGDAIARNLPGKWKLAEIGKGRRTLAPDGHDATDAKARAMYLGLWAWWQLDQLKAAGKALRVAAQKRLAAKDKAAKVKPRKKAGK